MSEIDETTVATREPRRNRTPAERARDMELYLEAVSKRGVLMESCKAVEGLLWGTVENWRRDYPEFAERVKEAQQRFGERLEGEVIRRGALGYQEPVFYKGRQVTDKEGNPVTVTKYSDRLLELAIKKHIPAYRERIAADVNITGGVLVVPGVATSVEGWAEKHGTVIEEGDASRG